MTARSRTAVGLPLTHYQTNPSLSGTAKR